MATKQEQPLEGFVLISRPRWLWLLILTFAVIAMLIYGFLGAVPRTVRGSGITRDDGRILTVAAPRAGIVEQVLVKDGDRVEVDTPMMGYDYVMTVGAHVPDELVEKILAYLHDNPEKVRSIFKTFAEFDPEGMAPDMGDLPYHPAAVSYYQSKGLMD